MDILKRLYELADEKYAEFQAKLTPNVEKQYFIGVRVPVARKLAKELYQKGEYADFLTQLPHAYYDENMLHGLILSEMKDFDDCISKLNQFLPYVDNWAVCDIMSPKCFKKQKEKLLPIMMNWIESDAVYTFRFGVEMLMTHFLDADFKKEYLDYPIKKHHEDYYAKMMVAWFYATALAKQWESTIPFLEKNAMDVWTHNKTLQKARESFRITPEQKEYLSTLKRKE